MHDAASDDGQAGESFLRRLWLSAVPPAFEGMMLRSNVLRLSPTDPCAV